MLFKGPIPKFKYEANSFDRGLCIAGGSGITPMWQLITHSLDLPEDKTKWTLVFSNVTDKDICEYNWRILADPSVAQRVGRFSRQEPRQAERQVRARQGASRMEG
jgi:NAD(P)H-flavin reductase